MLVNTCTDCGKPTGRPGHCDYLRCYGCQIEFNRLLYHGGRPAEADELEPRISALADRAAHGRPLFSEGRP